MNPQQLKQFQASVARREQELRERENVERAARDAAKEKGKNE